MGARERPDNGSLLARARRSVAGGDSSNMRVLPYHPPLVIDRGEGCRVWDVSGNEYVDLNMGYGPLLFGHRPAFVIDAVVEQIRERGSMFGFPQRLNFEVAEKIQQLFPSMQLMRFANSGTEAVAAVVRVARAYTDRPGIVLFEGHYHGWNDQVFHRYHTTLGELSDQPGAAALPGCPGMNGSPANAWMARFNDLDNLRACLARHPDEVAAVIMEPVMGNSGVVAPHPGFLAGVREAAHEVGALLIFDEVITGLRVAAGGAQQRYGVRPDLTVLSKALGGGFPVAAFGGAMDIMDLIARGKVFHGGVYSGNASVLAAANAVLNHILSSGQPLYDRLEDNTGRLAQGIAEILRRHRLPHVVQHVGPMLAIYLTREDGVFIQSYRDARRYCDFEGFIRLQAQLLDCGVYIHPNQFEPQYLSTAHTPADIDSCLDRFNQAVRIFSATRMPTL